MKNAAIIFLLTFVFHHTSLLSGQEQDSKNITHLMKLKKYAYRLEYFPLQKIIFSSGHWYVDDFFARSKDGRVFYDFMDFARRATENDLQECVDYLKLATPKERCLILIVFHCSLKTEYLPIIAEYVNDRDVAFPTWASYYDYENGKDTITKVPTDDFFNCELINNKVQNDEKISRYERLLLIDINNRLNSSTGPIDIFSEQFNSKSGGKSVAKFARAILGMWGCVDKENKNIRDNDSRDWSMPSEEYWKQFESRNHLLCYYANMYMTQVECSQPEYFDIATKLFLSEVEKLPVKYRLLVLLQTDLCSRTYNKKTNKDLFILFTTENYPFPCRYDYNLTEFALKNEQHYNEEWIALLKQIPKDELLELVTTKTPEMIDPDILYSFVFYSNGGAYVKLKMIIMQYQDSLFTASEKAML